MPFARLHLLAAATSAAALALVPSLAPAQSVASTAPTDATATSASLAVAADATSFYSAMRWREIGPTRAGRARAISGVASQPNVFYAGFDNGGVWRSTDYGSNWVPLFDRESTGSIGAIAVAPSDPNVIYVGSGAGIIRPDLATGNGMYKTTDAGKTWTHLGLRDTRMIANVEVNPGNPNRVFVAALGHPYGPNAERGVFRSTDGGKTFEKVLYKDEYTGANDVRIDPAHPNVVYAALWQQQESFIEGKAFGGTSGGVFKSTDGGTTWRQLTSGLPSTLIEANLAVSRSNPNVIYAMVAARGEKGNLGGDNVAFYKSTDAGEHWHLAFDDRKGANAPSAPDPRPLRRIGGGDLPTIVVDPKNENVVYSSSTVFWRTDDGGVTWSAVRGSPGGDDYQKTWINPNDPNVIFVVSDQGAVVSTNHGESWSNWYTQNTAAMYHVTTDDAFPYRVCGGQQDSGSACVESRSMDGEITFHDWHPVDIQEYGVAAPDPKDPDLVYGSMRTNVSLYNRHTGQTTYLGPSAAQREGMKYGRNVRTMPIAWSPVRPDVLYYVSNVVWKSTDHAHSWTRISPDLTRQAWAVPASAGKYASTVTAAPQGSLTALALSSRDANVIWAGSDDGSIQTTSDGGAHWRNVTPSAIVPWTRIFNIDAGHFDTQTAYAAANTMRVNNPRPHFFRTHDGGKTWTEIDTGIAPRDGMPEQANSIREDPRQRGLLYASTETQVYVSFDDGDHWQSLRLNMPAISVRDIQVKDDSICHCADLVAATHGRGFWILDDVTPLRQVAAARAAKDAYLYKPQTALRVRFGTNDPTPWPPELPAGQNPLPGAVIDYYLPAATSSPVRLEILDHAGHVIRTYASTDPVLTPHPALDREAYTLLCERDPKAPNCALPLYWPGPPFTLGTDAGMHRFSWDMHYAPIVPDTNGVSDEDATGAVPERTYPSVNAPWAPPGEYTVRLTVNGHTMTQPLTVRLDPRVTTPAAGLAQLASLSREMYDDAVAAHAASVRAASSNAASAKEVDEVTAELMTAAMSMQGADVTPTAEQIAACDRARTHFKNVMRDAAATHPAR